jgi:translation initiation factor 1
LTREVSLKNKGTPMSERPPRSRLAYTTDPEPETESASGAAPAYPSAAQQTARIARDRKRRAGKTVTVVSGLRHDPATLEALLKKLKQQCGAGGTLKDGEIEIQGDHRERVAAVLAAMGYKVKHVGG